MTWQIHIEAEVRDWLHELRREDPETLEDISAAIENLKSNGPSLGRPLVDRVKGSSLHNLKELRPGSEGASEVRMLFIFDEQRQAVFLTAGDKAGDWNAWYDENIPLAEERYDRHKADCAAEGVARAKTPQATGRQPQSRGRRNK